MSHIMVKDISRVLKWIQVFDEFIGSYIVLNNSLFLANRKIFPCIHVYCTNSWFLFSIINYPEPQSFQ